MRIVSWNVNGFRACIEKGFFDFFYNIAADIFCIQEIKMNSNQFVYSVPDYIQYWNCAIKRGYAGTLVFSKEKAMNIFYGIDHLYTDEGRVLTLEFENYYVVNCYSPHSQRNLAHLEYKREFDSALARYIGYLKVIKPVILCGDLNIAHREIDLKNYKTNKKNAGFTLEERKDFDQILAQGFTDSYRYKFPYKSGAYTWWSYRKGVRDRNIGWRIDYIIIADELKDKLGNCSIYSNVSGSDHCPIGAEINL